MITARPSSVSDEICGKDRIELAPGGGQLVLTTTRRPGEAPPFTRLASITRECSSGQLCAHRLEGLGRVEFLSWLEQDNTFLIRRRGEILRFGYDNRSNIVQLESLPLRVPIRISIGIESASRRYDDAVQEINSAYRSLSSRQVRDGVSGIYSLDQLLIVSQGPEYARILQRNGAERVVPAVIPADVHGNAHVSLNSGSQVIHLEGWSSRGDLGPYESYILDHRRNIVGIRSPKGVRLSSDHVTVSTQIESHIRDNPNLILTDVAIISDRSAYALFRGIYGDDLVYFNGGAKEEYSCRYQGPGPSVDRWQIKTIELDSRRILLHDFSGSSQPAGLVVYLHGGPGGNMTDQAYIRTVGRFVELGYRVIGVDGAGARGIGINGISSLMNAARSAIELDARAITNYINEQQYGYDRLVIYAESFGAPLGLLLARQLDTDGIILVAPWLNHREPSELYDPRSQSARFEYQVRWENNIFGDRESPSNIEFRQWLINLANTQEFRDSDLIVFADGDRISRRDDVRVAAAKMFEVPMSSHATITSDRRTWQLIRDHLQSLE